MKKPDGYPDTPEHQKLHARRSELILIQSFVQWLDAQPERIGGFALTDDQKARVIARYFDVDADALDAEKQAILDFLHEGAPSAC